VIINYKELKKVFYISAIILGLGFVSCQKQDVTPNSQEADAPEWQDVFEGSENARGSGSGSEGDGTGMDPGTTDPPVLEEDGDITDPEHDDDD